MTPHQTKHQAKRDRIVELYRSGMSLGEVGKVVGLSRGAVRSAMVTAGEPTRTYQEGWKLKCPDGHLTVKPGHKKLASRLRLGDRAAHWKGGRHVRNHARSGEEIRSYVYVYRPDHPEATKDGYVMEHRLVAEEQIGRLLTRDEVVHHVNGNRLDNRPENLQVMTRREHVRLHYSHAALVDQLQQELARYRAVYGPLPPCA